jgi:hypothetical protein
MTYFVKDEICVQKFNKPKKKKKVEHILVNMEENFGCTSLWGWVFDGISC